MRVKVYLLNAFGISKEGGNPAGVVLDADFLSNTDKKKISKTIGFSETAFVQKSTKADFKLTFFTPVEEVDLCGHATVAVYSLLMNKQLIKPGVYKQELKAGVLPIEIKVGETVIMDQSLPTFYEQIPVDDIINLINIEKKVVLGTGLKPQIVSTGLKDIFVPLKSRKDLFNLKPDFKKMSLFNKKTKTIGFHAFTLDIVNKKSVANCRNFAPLYGITEEAATGSSTGALACYLYKYDRLGNYDLNKLFFEQGYSMNKPSEIVAALSTNSQDISRIQVGGKAIFLGEKEFDI